MQLRFALGFSENGKTLPMGVWALFRVLAAMLLWFQNLGWTLGRGVLLFF